MERKYKENFGLYLVKYTLETGEQREIIYKEKSEEYAVYYFQRDHQRDYDWVSPKSKD